MIVTPGQPNPANIKQQFYDRTLSPFVLGYAATAVAPHVRTTRSTRTVPASTIDNIVSLFASLFQASAPGVAGKALAEITVFPAGFAERTMVGVPMQTGIAGTDIVSNSPTNLFLPAASVLTIYTTDGSTTGTVDYIISYAFNNFAA